MTSRLAQRNQRDYSPVSWTNYFDEAHDISLEAPQRETIDVTETQTQNNDSFRVYLKNFQHPYAPKREPGSRLDPDKLELSASELDAYMLVPTLVMLHGGGYSGLTWAQFVHQIDQQCQCRMLAIDLRSHGDTKTNDDERMDIKTLVSDVVSVTHSAHRICGFPETPRLVLIGHSMGGAIAINCAYQSIESLPSLAGFVIIDVVEGTAKEALPLMMSVIKTRPARFKSLSMAIEWSVRSGMAKNSEAARVSMPGNLVNIETGHLSCHDVPVDDNQTKLVENIERHIFHISHDQLKGPCPHAALLPTRLPLPPRVASLKNNTSSMLPPPPRLAPQSITTTSQPTISEDVDESHPSEAPQPDHVALDPSGAMGDDKQMDMQASEPHSDLVGYAWRTDLAKTQPYWNAWFDKLSCQMLAAPVQGKFLLLAGIDRLDKTLTIGHMQGKFMMKVLPKCGHAVHEDVPDQVALAIGDFLVRNKFAAAANK